SGFRETLAAAETLDLACIAAATGLGEDELLQFYELFAATQKTVTVYSQGVNQSSQGTDKVNAIINCHLATGRIGKPGAGPFSVTGQPNAMGGRE
ncbi:nitrate reductase, partial [bacterium M00.F.Ca.ET.157.01.1.1]